MTSKEKKYLIAGLFLLAILRKSSARTMPAVSPGMPDNSLMGKSFQFDTFPAGLGRGMKINNPGNLRDFGDNWQGRVVPGRDSSFITFSSYVYGLRAMIKLLKNYITQGNNTISKILNRYAPSSENDTDAYITYVEQGTGINRNKVLNGSYSELRKMVKYMANLEQGVDAMTDTYFDTAYNLL